MLVYKIKKLMYIFEKEKYFDLKAQGNESTRDRTLLKSPKSPGSMASASGISKTTFFSSDSDKLRIKLKLLLQERPTDNNSNINNDEIIALVDKLLQNKWLSKKQHKYFLIIYNLLHK